MPARQGEPILIVDAIDPEATEPAVTPGADGFALRLGGGTDPLTAILRLLDRRDGVAEVHIVCRGGPGRLDLGATQLCLETLTRNARARRQLRSIGRRLGPSGALVFGGADVGQGDAGLAFLQALADLTGIEVAAMVRCRPQAPAPLALT